MKELDELLNKLEVGAISASEAKEFIDQHFTPKTNITQVAPELLAVLKKLTGIMISLNEDRASMVSGADVREEMISEVMRGLRDAIPSIEQAESLIEKAEGK